MVTASAALATVGGDRKAEPVDDSSTPVDSLDDAINNVSDSRLPQNLQQLREKLYARDDDEDDGDSSGVGIGCRGVAESEVTETTADDDDDSSDEGCDHRRNDCDDEDDDDDDDGKYATLSARSVCSATTAANDDFEYFAATVNDEPRPPQSVERDSSPVSPGDGVRVPYHRAPTRRAKHHQPHHHHHHHHQPTQYQQQHHLHQQHRKMQRTAPGPSQPLPPTPPTPRRPKARLTSVLSVDSLVAAQAAADAATGHFHAAQPHKQQHHHPYGGRHRGGFGGIAGRRLGAGGARGHHGGSVPDLKRVFVTDFL